MMDLFYQHLTPLEQQLLNALRSLNGWALQIFMPTVEPVYRKALQKAMDMASRVIEDATLGNEK